LPVAASQTCAVVLAVTTQVPSRLNVALATDP